MRMQQSDTLEFDNGNVDIVQYLSCFCAEYDLSFEFDNANSRYL